MSKLLDSVSEYLVGTVGVSSADVLGSLRGLPICSDSDKWVVAAVYEHIHRAGYTLGDLISALLNVSTVQGRERNDAVVFLKFVSDTQATMLPTGVTVVDLRVADGSLREFLSLSDFSVSTYFESFGDTVLFRVPAISVDAGGSVDVSLYASVLKSVGVQVRNRYALYLLILLKLVWLSSCGLSVHVYADLQFPLDFFTFLFESGVSGSLGSLHLMSGFAVNRDLLGMFKYKGGTTSTLWSVSASDAALEPFSLNLLNVASGVASVEGSRSLGVASTLSLKDWVFEQVQTGGLDARDQSVLFHLILPDRESAWPSGVLLTSESSGIPVTSNTLLRVLILFAVCRVLDTVPDNVHFRAPDTSAPGFTSWVADCVVFSLFNQYNTVMSVCGNPVFPFALDHVMSVLSDPRLLASVSTSALGANDTFLGILETYLPQCSSEGRVFFDFCSNWLLRTLSDSIEIRGGVQYSRGIDVWDASFYQLRSVLSFTRKEKTDYNAALWGLTKRIRDGLSTLGILSI